MSDQFRDIQNDDFEKVDAEPYQDENVTSTSMTGDMAEEDRYDEGGVDVNEVDLLGGMGGMSSSSEVPDTNPLITFDQSPEPTAPPMPTETPVPAAKTESGEGLMDVPGVQTMCNWVKNVDPRDVPSVEEMAEPNEALPAEQAEPVAQPSPKSNPFTGVLELIYWRDMKKTGTVFGSMMIILLSLSLFSLMSVLAYLSIGILCVTISFRIYKNIMQAVQKTNDGHPFKSLLQMNIELQDEVVKNAADKIAQNINNCARELRRLYFVEDYVDTIKFGLLLWLLTYIGAWFNGMTLVILGVVSIFTLPKVYETYKVPIDQNVNLVRGNLNNIMAQVSAKIPFPKKKAKTQ